MKRTTWKRSETWTYSEITILLFCSKELKIVDPYLTSILNGNWKHLESLCIEKANQTVKKDDETDTD